MHMHVHTHTHTHTQTKHKVTQHFDIIYCYSNKRAPTKYLSWNEDFSGFCAEIRSPWIEGKNWDNPEKLGWWVSMVRCSATTDDIYLMHILFMTYIDDPYLCGHGQPIEPDILVFLATPNKLELTLDQRWSYCCSSHVSVTESSSMTSEAIAGARYGTRLKSFREPTNLHDPLNCVVAWVPRPWSSSHRASHISQKRQTVESTSGLLLSCD